ncbi:MAG: uracil-DNA glycosylase family protein [bacterium]
MIQFKRDPGSSWVVNSMWIKDGKAATHPCDECPVYKEGKFDPVLPDPVKIPEEKSIFAYIVGEAPGAEECKAKGLSRKPFIGRSGALLRAALEEANCPMHSIRIWNTVLCCLGRTPSLEESNVCREYVQHDIQEKEPGVLILLGLTAAYAFFPEVAATMSGFRMSSWEWKGIPTQITYHPSFILRHGGAGKGRYFDWLHDLKVAMDKGVPF